MKNKAGKGKEKQTTIIFLPFYLHNHLQNEQNVTSNNYHICFSQSSNFITHDKNILQRKKKIMQLL